MATNKRQVRSQHTESSRKRAKIEREETNQPDFFLVVGSYERILYGVSVTLDQDNHTINLKAIFSFPAHQSCIKAVSACRTSARKLYLATSSTDDTLKLWDLAKRSELGTLNAHQGLVTNVAFSPASSSSLDVESKYMITCSDDSTVNLFRTKDWALIRTFKGHKSRVNAVAVHPNSRVAISCGHDRTIRVWDLLGSAGQAAGGGKDGSNSTALGIEAEDIRWSTKGDRFAILCNRELRIYKTDMTLLKSLDSKSRFHDVQFAMIGNNEYLLVACEDGKVRIFALPTIGAEEMDLRLCAMLVGHKARVKSVQILPPSLASPFGSIATTISSDGFIHIYEVGSSQLSAEEHEIQPSAKYDTKGSRLTCLTVIRTPSDLQHVSVNGQAESDSESESEADSESDSAKSSQSDDSSEDNEAGVEEEWGGISENEVE